MENDPCLTLERVERRQHRRSTCAGCRGWYCEECTQPIFCGRCRLEFCATACLLDHDCEGLPLPSYAERHDP